jgi:hypothetical protein
MVAALAAAATSPDQGAARRRGTDDMLVPALVHDPCRADAGAIGSRRMTTRRGLDALENSRPTKSPPAVLVRQAARPHSPSQEMTARQIDLICRLSRRTP